CIPHMVIYKKLINNRVENGFKKRIGCSFVTFICIEKCAMISGSTRSVRRKIIIRVQFKNLLKGGLNNIFSQYLAFYITFLQILLVMYFFFKNWSLHWLW